MAVKTTVSETSLQKNESRPAFHGLQWGRLLESDIERATEQEVTLRV